MTDKTKNFLTELADLLDKYEGGIAVMGDYDGTVSVDVFCERDTYVNVSNTNVTGSDIYIEPKDIRKLTKL